MNNNCCIIFPNKESNFLEKIQVRVVLWQTPFMQVFMAEFEEEAQVKSLQIHRSIMNERARMLHSRMETWLIKLEGPLTLATNSEFLKKRGSEGKRRMMEKKRVKKSE